MKRRANKTGRSDKTARHIRIYHMTLRTAAWKSLDAVARALYVEILSRYNGSNNGRIPYSIREGAAALRIGKTKSAVGLKDLQDRGFIAAITRGGFNRKNRHATEWRITEFACDVTGALPTYDYQRWSFQNAVPSDGREVLRAGRRSRRAPLYRRPSNAGTDRLHLRSRPESPRPSCASDSSRPQSDRS